MRVSMLVTHDDPNGRLADVEIFFEEGLLEGLKLTGISIGEHKEKKYKYVLLPSRKYRGADGYRYFNYLRDGEGIDSAKAFKHYLLQQYEARVEEKKIEEPRYDEEDLPF